MPVSLDSECPSCHKWFDNESLVLRHMNNPWTSCASWNDFVGSIPLELPRYPLNNHSNQDPRTNDEAANNNSTDHHAPGPMHYEGIHPNHPSIFGLGPGFMDAFNSDPSAEKRGANIYYPFSSKEEWGLASWLLCSGLSMRAINDFLALPIMSLEVHITASPLMQKKVRQLSLSFATAKTLRTRMDNIPTAPEWKMQDIPIKGYETVKPVVLFYRDPLECIQALLRNPIFEGKWDFTPRKVYNDPGHRNRIYSEWMMSDGAWAAQVCIPPCSSSR